MERLKNKSRKVRMFVYERIRLTIPKSSKLYCYVKARKQKKDIFYKTPPKTNFFGGWDVFFNIEYNIDN